MLRPRSSRVSAAFLIGLSTLGAGLVGCATGDGTASPSVLPASTQARPRAIPFEEEHALLLLMSDRRLFEPMAVASAFEGDADLRSALALTLGRIGDVRGVPPLQRLLGDADPAVRRVATFALGELGQVGQIQGVPSLLDVTKDSDREVGVLAVEALSKSGVDLETVVARLIDVPPDEFLPRLVPSLYRFDSPGVVGWAGQALERARETSDDAMRRQAAYALGRTPRLEGVPLLRELLADQDPWIRGWAARALGRVGDGTDLERLFPLLADEAEGPVIQALRAGKRLVDGGDVAAPDTWRPHLVRVLTDANLAETSPGVRLTAIEASAAWLLDDEIAAPLLVMARGGEDRTRARELALLALAEGEDPRLAVVLPSAVLDPSPQVRTAAARAAGLSANLEVLAALLLDEHPLVRRTAIDTLLAAEPPDASELLLRALDDPDPGVRSLAIDWGGARGLLDPSILGASWIAAQKDVLPDAKLSVLRALARLGATDEANRAAVVERLQAAARDQDWLIRREASASLAALGAKAPAPGSVETGLVLENYRDIVRRTRGTQSFDLATEHGVVGLAIDCPVAPMTCLSFGQLADQGFFAGLVLHRIVPDFVVQGGDPRGDGLGGPGYELRDEVNPLRFDRHVVGMAHAGRDTAGSQFFVTLAAQPHLDGTYTAFGRVVAGTDVLHRLVQGDRILSISRRSERSTPPG